MLKGNVHLKAADGTPMANVMLTLLHKLGLDDMKTFGDSTGEFSLSTSATTVERAAVARASLRGSSAKPHLRFDRSLRADHATSLSRSIVGACRAALARRGAVGSPVADAAMHGDRDAVRALLKQGADVNARAGRRHDGAALGRRARRRRAGGDARLRRRQRRRGDAHRPVHAAPPRRRRPAARRSCRRCSRPARRRRDARPTSGVTPLHLAAASGNADVVTRLLDARRRRERQGSRVGPDAADLRGGAEPRRGDQARCSRAAPTRTIATKIDRHRQAERARSRGRRAASRRCSIDGVGAEGPAADAPARFRRPIAGGARAVRVRQDSAARTERGRRGERRNAASAANNFNPGRDQPAGRQPRAA